VAARIKEGLEAVRGKERDLFHSHMERSREHAGGQSPADFSPISGVRRQGRTCVFQSYHCWMCDYR
jgi:hypothetical protein